MIGGKKRVVRHACSTKVIPQFFILQGSAYSSRKPGACVCPADELHMKFSQQRTAKRHTTATIMSYCFDLISLHLPCGIDHRYHSQPLRYHTSFYIAEHDGNPLDA